MFTINDNYLKLQGSYLFSNIAKKVADQTLTLSDWESVMSHSRWHRLLSRLFTVQWMIWQTRIHSMAMHRTKGMTF